MSKQILLNSEKHPGHMTTVDDEDYDILIQYKWHPHFEKNSNNVYACSSIIVNQKQTEIKMHRFLMQLHGHDIENKIIDHQDQNGINNQKENLRICTRLENSYNSKKPRNGKTSKYKGVYLHTTNNNFIAHIRANGKMTHIGSFDNEEDAAYAYNEKAIEYFGEFASLNIIN
jgi:hypothetical protein